MRDTIVSRLASLIHAHHECFFTSGKSSVGKSSLVNSILNEQVSRVMAFKLQADTEMTTPITKQVGSTPY